MISIAYIIGKVGNFPGGMEKTTLTLIKELNKRQYKPYVFLSGENILDKTIKEAGLEVVHVNMESEPKATYNPLKILIFLINIIVSAFRMLSEIKKRKINIIHTNSRGAHICGGIIGKLLNT